MVETKRGFDKLLRLLSWLQEANLLVAVPGLPLSQEV